MRAQVGINKPNPSAILDVDGDIIVDQTLTLENPGNSLEIRGLNLLVVSTANDMLQYDIDIAKYGPINNVQFEFTDLSYDGLQDYNTQVPVDEYEMVVHSFFFKRVGSDNYNVLLGSNSSVLNVEGYQVYAYKHATHNTWFLRAIVNDSSFQIDTGSGTIIENNIDMILNVALYRKGLLTKTLNEVNVDMGTSSTGTAPLPAGFTN